MKLWHNSSIQKILTYKKYPAGHALLSEIVMSELIEYNYNRHAVYYIVIFTNWLNIIKTYSMLKY